MAQQPRLDPEPGGARPGAVLLCALALESDIADIPGGTAPAGIPPGAMAGTVALDLCC